MTPYLKKPVDVKNLLMPRARLCFFYCGWLLLLLLAGSRSSSYAYGYFQDKEKVTVSGNNITLREVFSAIQKQTRYRLFYSSELLNDRERTSIHVKDATVEQVLQRLLNGRRLEWNYSDNVIILRKAAPIDNILPGRNDSLTTMITGIITDAAGAPLVGATVLVKGTGKGTQTNDEGQFMLGPVARNAVLVMRYTGYVQREVALTGSSSRIEVKMQLDITEMSAVSVVSTGYQQLPKERVTGSFVKIDNALLNRSVSTDIMSRLKGVTSGLLFDESNTGNAYGISVRGRSTIFANTAPLIVVDNFPYDGDINNINPNDVESITILKDAAAASIWGARSGNGVIVITTKKGSYNQPVRVSFNSNITVGGKPDLFYLPNINSSSFIEVEKFLFDKGYYDNDLLSPVQKALTPAVEILVKKREGKLSAEQAESQLTALGQYDIRNDLLKYAYRTRVNQQYAVNLSGGGPNQQYYVSLGYDKNLNNAVGDKYNRISVNANNTYALLKHKLEINTGILFAQTRQQNNALYSPDFGGGSLYPYAQIAGADGQPLPVARYRQGYIDTAGRGKLLDWNYFPLDEMGLADNTNKGTSYLVNLGIKYKVIKALDITLNYQYGRGLSEMRKLYSRETFYTRNYINRFTQIDWNTGRVTRPVPLGDILDWRNTEYTSHNTRAQLNYNNTWNGVHQLAGIAGGEIRDYRAGTVSSRFYGYNAERGTSIPVNFLDAYPSFIDGSSIIIESAQDAGSQADRNVSYFTNVAYTYDQRYTFSASVRNDASNLFGVKTNQKWAPFWSAGAAWNLGKEYFYHVKWLPHLKFRVTYGYNGNVDKTVSAFLVTQSLDVNRYGAEQSAIFNPPNPALRWEKIRQINAGLDFATRNNRVSGSIEYYHKYGTDLMGDASLPPSSGLPSYRGNTANMTGSGVDLRLSSDNMRGTFAWNTTLLLNFNRDRITSYNIAPAANNDYTSGRVPIVGKPFSALYSFRWGGLDAATGDPQGVADGKTSKEYGNIINSADPAAIVYNGPSQPAVFGGMINTLSWKQFMLSFNITYKFGYYFRRTSIDYYGLFMATRVGHSDYDNRWQKPGDEQHTQVPSMIYPADPTRDQFYRYAEILVEKGDHIRLQDIRLSYDLSKQVISRLPFEHLQLYLYANNLGILWRANDLGLDPDIVPYPGYSLQVPLVKTLAAGIKIDF